MKPQGSDFIIRGLFVFDMMHISTYDKLRDESSPPYQKYLDGKLKTFLEMKV